MIGSREAALDHRGVAAPTGTHASARFADLRRRAQSGSRLPWVSWQVPCRGFRLGPHMARCRSRLDTRSEAVHAPDRHTAAGGWQGGPGALPLPLPLRWAWVGAAALGPVGAIAGLVVGLIVHPPTALFAMLELAALAILVGGLVGLGSGSIVVATRQLGARRRDERWRV